MGNISIDQIDSTLYINNGPDIDGIPIETLTAAGNILGTATSFELHESINSMFRYGNIVIEDTYGVRESRPITGNEVITMMYRNSVNSTFDKVLQYKVIHFNIFDMEEIQEKPGARTEEKFTKKLLKFHVVEAPFFFKLNKKRWQKTFGSDDGAEVKSKKIDDIVRDMVNNDLKLNPKLVSLDFHKMSKDMMPISCPNWKAQKFFSYLLDFAKDENDFGNVKLFTTSNTEDLTVSLNLKSMLGMFLKPRHPTVEYVVADSSTTNKQSPDGIINDKNINIIYQYKFLTYDFTSAVSSLAGGVMYNYDYSTSKYYDLYETYNHVNQNNPYFMNFALWRGNISDFDTKAYYLGSLPKPMAKSFLQNKTTDKNYQLKCEILTTVNENVGAGDSIFITFMSGMATMNSGDGLKNLIDEQMSGSWIVEEMVDAVSLGRGVRKMIIVRDSFFNIYEKDKRQGKETLPEVTAITTKSNNGGIK